MNDTALLDELAQLAVRRIGLRIPDDAYDRFAGMLRERAAHLGYSLLQDYRTFLLGGQAAEEWEHIARTFTTGETFFFRDHGQFDLLRLRLLPELIAQHRYDKTLRLWSAGCASGEEVYSLAMLVDMLLPQRSGWNILILGTDIDSAAIAKARHGHYGKWSFRMIPPELQQRYFNAECGVRSAEFSTPHSPVKGTPVGSPLLRSDPSAAAIGTPHSNEWILDERIRRMVTFRVSNLVGEPFPDSASELHDMDLILCRNVFIYFDPAAVFAVAAKFAATLREGGYLLTAHTELIGHPVQGLESRLFAEGVVYQRRVQVPAPTPFPHPNLLDKTTSHSTKLPKTAAKSLVTPHAGEGVIAPSLARSAGDTHNIPPPPLAGEAWPVLSLSKEGGGSDTLLLKEARAHADRGEFNLAEQACRKALVANPLAAAPYFLLAQLAQVKGNFELAKECLNKAIYIDHRFVAAYLELAALCGRAEDMPRAQTLRRAALGIVRTMPNDAVIEQYETTAGYLTQWLAQWESEPTEGTLKESKL